MAWRATILFPCDTACSSIRATRDRRCAQPGLGAFARTPAYAIDSSRPARPGGAHARRDFELTQISVRRCVARNRVDVRTAFVGGPLIPWGFVVSVVIALGSRLGRFFAFNASKKHQRGPRAGPAPDVVNYSDPVRFPFSPGV